MWKAWTGARACCFEAEEEVERRMIHYPYQPCNGVIVGTVPVTEWRTVVQVVDAVEDLQEPAREIGWSL